MRFKKSTFWGSRTSPKLILATGLVKSNPIMELKEMVGERETGLQAGFSLAGLGGPPSWQKFGQFPPPPHLALVPIFRPSKI